MLALLELNYFLSQQEIATDEDRNPESPLESNPPASDGQPSLHPGPPVKKRRYGGSSTDQVLTVIKDKISGMRDEDQCDIFGRSVAANLRDLPKEMKIYAQKLINDVIFNAQLGKLNERSQILTTEQVTPVHVQIPNVTYLTQPGPSTF